MARQMELEDMLREEGIRKFKASLDRLRSKRGGGKDKHGHSTDRESQMADSPAGRALLRKAVQPYVTAIEAMLAEAWSGKPGRKSHAARHLRDLPVADVAVTALRTILDHILDSHGMRYTSLSIRVGSRVIQEAAVLKWCRANRNLLKRIEAEFKTQNETHHYRVLRAAAARDGVHMAEVDKVEAVQVGEYLLQIAANTLGLFTIEKRGEAGKRHATFKVRPTDKLTAWAERYHEHLIKEAPQRGPMVVPPRPWHPQENGGYLFGMRDMIQWTGGDPDLAKASRKGSHMLCHRAINRLQEVPYRINAKVLWVLETIQLGGRGFPLGSGEYAQTQEHHIPPSPTAGLELARASADEKEAHDTWRRHAKELHDLNHSIRRSTLKRINTLAVARQYRDDPAIFFPMHFDFRGRLYYLSAGLTPQGGDVQKGLLEFAEGERLDYTGNDALAIHGANKFGIDKVSFFERVKWTAANDDRIKAVARDPINNTWWHEAKHPWQFLAFCFADDAACRGLPVHLPVQADGTCNGYQHISSLLRDASLGEAVNVTQRPGSNVPSDVYMEIASKLGTATSPIPYLDKITREAIKRPVMTVPYGATERTMAKASAAALGVKRWDELLPLARAIRQTLEREYPAVKDLTAWLKDVMGVLCATEANLAWHTPSGFLAAQRYFLTKVVRVNYKLPGRGQSYATLLEPTEKVDKPSARQKAIPNFLQSLDAAHIHLLAGTGTEAEKPRLGTIHDCILYHPNDAGYWARRLREDFIRLHRPDPLAQFARQVAEHVPGGRKALPPLPPKGDLDIKAVLSSPFFFS